MPRPKLYTTPEQRKEATRNKHRRFYNKHRTKILETKKSKREVETQRERQVIAQRQARSEKKRSKPVEPRTEVETVQKNVEERVAAFQLNREVQRDLEQRLEALKSEYQTYVEPRPRRFLDALCQQAIGWKQSTRLPVMKRTSTPSPVLASKSHLDNMLMRYASLQDEYFYLTRNKYGQLWEDKRREFTVFVEVVGQMVQVLADIQFEVDLIDVEDIDYESLREYYIHKYL